VIEDISVDGGNNYLITNPGFNFDEEADRLSAEALRLMASSSPKDQALGAVYQNRATASTTSSVWSSRSAATTRSS